ncbi:MAG: FkbM family methyltransferase, partial [Hyphomicrobiaceae bacterium]
SVTAANVAISDRIGTATLKLTTATMSSSLLELALHSRLYPSIKPDGEITVKTETLDSHINTQGMSVHDYNVLLIDVQGAELKVLEGAKNFLRSTDLVICEVNFEELYSGGAYISDLDLFLFDQGFVRIATATPYDPSWGDAAYVRSDLIADLQCLSQRRQHVVAMPSLGSNGRLGNQMFQYMFLFLYGLRSGCDVQIPTCSLSRYFNLPLSSPPGPDLPELKLLRDRETQIALEVDNPPRNLEFWGYFPTISRAHVLHRTLIRRLFKPKEDIEVCFAAWQQAVRSKYKRVIGLHIRRGDYVEFEAGNWMEFSRVPAEWFITWLAAHGDISENDGIFISSDDPDVKKKFARYRLVQDEVPLPEQFDREILEFLALSSCDIALLVNSSWSYMAALLGPDTQRAYRVDFHTQTFVPFDSWSSEFFWERYHGPGSLKAPDGGEVELAQSLVDSKFERAQLALIIRAPFVACSRYCRDLMISKYAYSSLAQKLVSRKRRIAWQMAAAAATERLASFHQIIYGRVSNRLSKRLVKQRLR